MNETDTKLSPANVESEALAPTDPRITDVGSIGGKTLKVISSSGFVLMLNNVFDSGTANSGFIPWKVGESLFVVDAWYVVEDAISEYSKFWNITVRPSSDHKDSVDIRWKGTGAAAAIRVRIFALCLE